MTEINEIRSKYDAFTVHRTHPSSFFDLRFPYHNSHSILIYSVCLVEAPLVIRHCPLTVLLNRIHKQLPFSSHDRLLRAMSSKDALVRDLKARIEVLTAREKAHSTAAANDLAKEKAKSKDSWKSEKEKDGDCKDDREKAFKPFVSSFGEGPPRCGTPTRLPPPPPPPPSGLMGGSSIGNIRTTGSKDGPKGFDSDVAELEIVAATAHLSASELRNR